MAYEVRYEEGILWQKIQVAFYIMLQIFNQGRKYTASPTLHSFISRIEFPQLIEPVILYIF